MTYQSPVLDVLAEHLPDCTVAEFAEVLAVVQFVRAFPLKGGNGTCQTLRDVKARADEWLQAAIRAGLLEPGAGDDAPQPEAL